MNVHCSPKFACLTEILDRVSLKQVDLNEGQMTTWKPLLSQYLNIFFEQLRLKTQMRNRFY